MRGLDETDLEILQLLLSNARRPYSDIADAVENVEVTFLARADRSLDLGGAAFALTCPRWGNTVDSEGAAARIGCDLYRFCCRSWETRFEGTYDRLRQEAD